MLTDPGQPQFLTTREVADLLRVKERKVYDLAAANEIPHRRITGKLLFPAGELRAWIEGGTTAERPAVLAGSHDPLLDWAVHASGCGLAMLCNGSADGLDKFQDRAAALTGLHLPEDDGWNIATVSGLDLRDAVLIGFATRMRGLLVAESQRDTIRSVVDLAGRRVALRQSGAGAALLLSRLLRQAGLEESDLVPAGIAAHSETEAAAAVAGGDADATLGLKASAKPYRLGFVPLAQEQFDLLIDRRAYFTASVQSLLAFCRGDEFAARAEALGGYDISCQGSVRWLSA